MISRTRSTGSRSNPPTSNHVSGTIEPIVSGLTFLPPAIRCRTVYDDILVPTDGSDESTAAVNHGVEIAEPHDATVHFLHVIDVGTEMSASGVGTIAPDLTESLTQEAEDVLDAAAARADEADVTSERTSLEGIPHEAITEYTTDQGIDLIVMGASGRTGLKEHLLGSSTDRVLRSVDTSVLVARP